MAHQFSTFCSFCLPLALFANDVIKQGSDTTILDSVDSRTHFKFQIFPTMVVSALVGTMSLFTLGIVPYEAVQETRKVDKDIRCLEKRYTALAKYWIDLYCANPKVACDIVDNFDVKAIKDRIWLKSYKKNVHKTLISSLEEAYDYIKNKDISEEYTEIRAYLHNITNV